MKHNKYFLFMLILICSLINISGNNSSIGIGESSNDSKRILQEQIDNYIILQFNKEIKYEGGNFFLNRNYKYNQHISFIMNGDKKLERDSTFTVKNNTKLEVHFNQNITDLESFLDAKWVRYFDYLISADFYHFDTSSVTNMNSMFKECSSLQSLYLSHFKTSSVTNMNFMFSDCTSLKYLIISNFDSEKVIEFKNMFDSL